jgi:hypothetical protein
MQPGYDPRNLRPMAVAPGGAGYPLAQGVPPMQVMVASNGFDALSSLPAIQVQEKANLLQEATAMIGAEIQQANRYNIVDGVNNQHFYAVETVDCCRRQLQTGCCHDCAPYEVSILYAPGGMIRDSFLQVKRPWQCTCCCINRPVADVIDAHSFNKIGSFKDPFKCCLMKFDIRDGQDIEVLEVDGGCCCSQPGFVCPLPCGPCSKVEFDVKDVQTRESVATVTKQVPSCLTWCCAPDVDNYHVSFDKVQHPHWKAILMAFTIFLDYRYFNVNRNQQEAERRRFGQDN